MNSFTQNDKSLLNQSEPIYRDAFEMLPVSVWIQDISLLLQSFEQLRAAGVSDLQQYIQQNPDYVLQAAEFFRVVDVNNRTVQMFEAPNKDVLLASISQVFDELSFDTLTEELIHFFNGNKIFSAETRYKTLKGRRFSAIFSIQYPENAYSNHVWVSITDISLQKEAERKLNESENRFRGAFETAAHGMAIASPRGNFLQANNAFCNMLGYTHDEITTMSFQQITHPDDLPNDLEKTKKLLAGEIESMSIEKRYYHRNGNIVWVNLSVSLVRDTDQTPLYFVGHIIDITQQKQAKVDLQHTATLLLNVINASSDFIFVKDLQLRTILCNNTFARAIGKTPEQTYGKTDVENGWLPELVFGNPEKNIRGFIHDDNDVLSGKTVHNPADPANVNGVIRYFDTIKTPVRNQQGDIIGVLGMSRDVTEQIMAQQLLQKQNIEYSGLNKEYASIIEELRQTNDSLNASEQRFAKLFHDNPTAMLLALVDTWTIVDVNTSTEQLFEIEREKIIGRTGLQLNLVDDNNDRLHIIEEIKKTGRVRNFQSSIVVPSGDIKHVLVSIEIIEVHFQQHVFAVFQDITPIKKAEEILRQQNETTQEFNRRYADINRQLNEKLEQIQHINTQLAEAKQRAEESDQLKSAFLANVSHEIRTPLNGILGFAELLQQPDIMPQQLDQCVDMINKSGYQLLGIINDIIEISKIDSHQTKLHIAPTHINEVIENVHQNFIGKLQSKQLFFNKHLATTNQSDVINTDKVKLQQILSNLVENAIKFTSVGGIEIGYKILPFSEIEFFVSDTGIGVAPEHFDLIFERFRQVEVTMTRNYGGTGLGLAISKAYTEMLGGKMRVESALGKGTTFYFTLPYFPANFVHVPQTQHLNTHFDWKQKHILIAEDDDSVFALLQRILENTGVNIIRATNGAIAIEKINTITQIDALLLDIKMPAMNGYDALEHIRRSNKQVPIIMQTSYAMDDQKQRAFDLGCNDYITKPIKRTELLNVLAKYLND